MAAKVGQVIVDFVLNTAKFETDLKKMSKSLKSIGKECTDLGKTLSVGITAPLVATGAAVVKFASDFDEGMDRIRAGTGATGKTLEGLGTSMKNVLAKVPQSVGDVSTAIADLNTRMGLTGKPLEEMATQLLNLARVTNSEVAPLIASSTRLFGDWSIATEKQSSTLDYLYKVSQSTGIGVQRLMDITVQYGAPLRALGFDMETAAAAMGKWEKEGVNMETVLAGLKIGLANFAKAGVEPAAALAQIEAAIKGAKTESEAMTIAIKAFGQRAGPDLARAVIEGRLSIDDLKKSIQSSGDTINRAAADTMSFGEKMSILGNKIAIAAAPLGDALLGALEQLMPYFEKAIKFVADLVKAFTELPKPVQGVAIAIAAVAAAAGPLLMVFGSMATGLIKILPLFASLGSALGSLSILGAVRSFGDLKAAAELLTSQLGLLGKAGLLAAAVFVGWELGTWLEKNIPLVHKFGEAVGGAVFKLMEWIGLAPDQKAALASLEAQTKTLADRLRTMGINVDRLANESIADWAKRVNETAQAHQKLKPRVDDTSTSTKTFGNVLDLTGKKLVAAGKDADGLKKELDKLEAIVNADRWRNTEFERQLEEFAAKGQEASAAFRDKLAPSIAALDDIKPRNPRAAIRPTDAQLADFNAAGQKAVQIMNGHAAAMALFAEDMAQDMSDSMSQAFDALTSNLVADLIDWKNPFESFKSFLTGFAKDALSILVDGLFSPVKSFLSSLAGNIGSQFASLLTGGGFNFGGLLKNTGGLFGLGGTALAGTTLTGATLAAPSAAAAFGGLSPILPTIGLAGGGTMAVGGTAAATGATAGGSGFMASMGALATNPITIAAAAAGVLTYLGIKFAKGKDSWEAGSMEAARDFGNIQVSKDEFKAWTEALGLSEKETYPIRKDLMSSPVALQWMAGLAEQQGLTQQFLSATEKVATAWGNFNFRDELEKGLKTGLWDDLNNAYKQAFGSSQALLQAIPDISKLFLENTASAEDAAAEAAGAADESAASTEESAKIGTSISSAADAMAKLGDQFQSFTKQFMDGMEKLSSRLEALLQNDSLGGRAVSQDNRSSTVTVRLGDVAPVFNLEGGITEQNIKQNVIPILRREMASGNTGLREAVRIAYDRTARAY